MIQLPLTSLSPEEKIQVMESLWDDLCRQAGSIASPCWHQDLLAQRESAIAQGTEQFEDWESAKRMIPSRLTVPKLSASFALVYPDHPAFAETAPDAKP